MSTSLSVFLTFVILLTISILDVSFAQIPIRANAAPTPLNYEYGHVPRTCKSKPTDTRQSLSEFVKEKFEQSSKSPLTIPCGYSLFENSSVSLKFPHGLIIKGSLEFLDSNKKALLNSKIVTPFIVVRGKLQIGTIKDPYKSRFNIILTNYTKDVVLENESPNRRFDHMLNFGKKAFVVYGGLLQLVGAFTGPTYTTLVQTAVKGDTNLVVKGNLARHWKTGDRIVISPSEIDTEAKLSTMSVISRIQSRGTGKNQVTEIYLTNPIPNIHSIRQVQLTDETNRVVRSLPVVSKINRNIHITGLTEGATSINDWWKDQSAEDGGHVSIANTAEQVIVNGVEISAMGQPGQIGRYPLHAHFLANVGRKKSIFKNNAIHHSKQRCIVIHATHGMRVLNNVNFRAIGHCLLTEDGAEKNNRFVRNVVISLIRARKLIRLSSQHRTQSDSSPTGIWMASPTNHIVKNIVSGAAIGYWFEAHSQLGGQSRDVALKDWQNINMQMLPMGRFKENTVYCSYTGLATYPDGLRYEGPKMAIIDQFFAFSVHRGWQVNIGKNQLVRKSVFVDVYNEGVQTQQFDGLHIEDTVFSGAIFNENEYYCRYPSIGIELRADTNINGWFDGVGGIYLNKVHFQNFNKQTNCRTNYGIYAHVDRNHVWLPSTTHFKQVTFDKVDKPFHVTYPDVYNKQLVFSVDNAATVKGQAFIVGNVFNNQTSLVKNCIKNDKSIDNWSNHSSIYLCKSSCWRQVSVVFSDKDELEPFAPLRVRLSNDKYSIDEVPVELRWWVVNRENNQIVSKILPAGIWNLELIDKSGKVVPKNIYDYRFFSFANSDAIKDYVKVSCKQQVEIKVHGRTLFQDV